MSQFHTFTKEVNGKIIQAYVWASSKTRARGRAYTRIGIFLKCDCLEMYFGDKNRLECIKYIN